MSRDQNKELWDQAYEAGAEEAKAKIADGLRSVGQRWITSKDSDGVDGYTGSAMIEMADMLDRTAFIMRDGVLHKTEPSPKEG